MNKPSEAVYYGTFSHQTWLLHLAATDAGLCCITLPDESYEMLTQWIHRSVPGARIIADQGAIEHYRSQLEEYFQGRRQSFTLPLDFHGTPFQESVWQALTRIPYGQTRSYSEIALAIKKPTAVRAVGAANGANPIPIVVPCHRVIGKNGTLTGYRGGLAIKQELLHLEGLSFTA